jgi:hypothetical protein
MQREKADVEKSYEARIVKICSEFYRYHMHFLQRLRDLCNELEYPRKGTPIWEVVTWFEEVKALPETFAQANKTKFLFASL